MLFVQVNITQLMQCFSGCWAEALHLNNLSCLSLCFCCLQVNPTRQIRPIGVGEVHTRIISKAVLSVFRLDIQDAAGPLQVYAGQYGGCEAAVHAMRGFFDNDETQVSSTSQCF